MACHRKIPTLGAKVANSVTDGQMDRKIMLLSHTLTTWGSHVASLVEFPPSGLGDSVTDRWTDGWKIMLLSYTLTTRRNRVESLVKFRSVV